MKKQIQNFIRNHSYTTLDEVQMNIDSSITQEQLRDAVRDMKDVHRTHRYEEQMTIPLYYIFPANPNFVINLADYWNWREEVASTS